MKLKISKFAKINDTEVVIDGITVIAGHNNTGKSTIGKILFSLFNSLNNIEEKIEYQRKSEITELCNSNIRNYISHSLNLNRTSIEYRKMMPRLPRNLAELIIRNSTNSSDYNKVSSIIINFLKKNQLINEDDPTFNEIIDNIAHKSVSIMSLSDSLVVHEILTRYFKKVFSGQINCLKEKDSNAYLELVIKDKTINITFNNNKCINCETSFNILHEAYYIDDPFIIDELSNDSYPFLIGDNNVIKDHIISKLSSNNFGIMDGIFDAVIAKEKLDEIFSILNTVVDGTLIATNGELSLAINNFIEPIKLNNLSTGLKSFVIIKMLLEKGILKEKDVLILDEPEIHLHPEWQLVYAEIIVLLQKVFDLSIVVTTHSSNFLEAIDYFSKKHMIYDKCNYYLANVKEGLSTFENVNNSLEKIYSEMVQPSVLLDKLKYEMECTHEE